MNVFLKKFFSSEKKPLADVNKTASRPLPTPPKTDSAFAEEKEILGQILQHIQEGIITTNLEGSVAWANRKALEILRTSWVTTRGKPINQVLPGSQTNQQNFQTQLITLDGEKITVMVKAHPLLNRAAAATGKIYVLENITEKLALEEMKLDFVAIAAHQLRTPLTAIKGYLNILSQTIVPKLNPEEQKFFQRSVISADRLGSLIENLLNVSRVEKGALKIYSKPVDLIKLVQGTIGNLLENAKENEVQLSLGQLAPPYSPVFGSADLLQEALTNIISNGIKYNHPGGQVNVFLEKQTDGITIHISDTGKGIPEKNMSHLFQRFYQGTGSLAELSNGLGLGLYISKSIIDAHKGKIWINSLEGKGTTVSVFLPTATQ